MHPRVAMNGKAAAEIYCKLLLIGSASFKPTAAFLKVYSVKLAKKYGVSVNTIRDIWNKRSWVCSTVHLWGSSPPYSNDELLHMVRIQFELLE